MSCSCGGCAGAFIGIWAVILIIAIAIVASGFGVIKLNTAGLLYDPVALKLEENTIYLPGRYWKGLGKTFMTYPTTAQYINFFIKNENKAIKCKSADKSEIDVEIIVVYKLRPEFLFEHYNAFLNRDYKDVYKNLVRSKVQNTCSSYQMRDFIDSRTEISQAMADAVNKAMRTDMYSELVYFQLKNIDLNSNLEGFLVQNFDSKNQIIVENILKQSQKIEGQIEILYSEARKEATNILSKANNTADYYLNQAKSEVNKNSFFAGASAYEPFIEVAELNFTQKELNKFLFYMKLDDITFFDKIRNNFNHGFNDIGRVQVKEVVDSRSIPKAVASSSNVQLN